MGIVSVGVPAWPEISGGWSLWPLVGVGLSLFIVRRVLRLGSGPGALMASVVAGSLFALAVDAWGVPATLMVVVLVVLSLEGLQRAAHRHVR